MALGDTLSEYGVNISMSGFGKGLTWFFIAIIVFVFVGIGLFMFLRWKKFNKDIVILEDVAGSEDLEPVGKDKAMLVKAGKGGLEILYLRKRKVYRGAYGKRMGKNRYYFAIGPDGYWYNVTLGSLSQGMKTVKIKPTHVNMRYQNESLQEIIKSRYEQEGFWSKYGQMILNIGFIAFLVIMSWFLFQSFQDAAGGVAQAAETTREVAEQLSRVVGALDTLKSSGGLTPSG